MSLTSSYFISAGEFSGDILGAELIDSLRNIYPDLQPFGLCGQKMLSVGGKTIEDLQNLSVLGVAELWTKLHYFRRLEQRVIAVVERYKPKFAILIDYPGFHFRLAELFQPRGIPTFQYVAPKTWAWGEKRTALLAKNFKAIFGIFPFEESFFRKRNVNYHYVGTPHVDRVAKISVPAELQKLKGDSHLLACLPGSRLNEIREHLPVITEVITNFNWPEEYKFIIPVAENLGVEAIEEVLGAKLNKNTIGCITYYYLGKIFFISGLSLEILSLATAAVVASGTATLECALLDVPAVVFYKTNPLTYSLAKDNLTVSFLSLVNIIRGKKVITEHIQEFSPADIVSSLQKLLKKDKDSTEYLQKEYKLLASNLQGNAPACTANLIYNYLH